MVAERSSVVVQLKISEKVNLLQSGKIVVAI